MLTDPYRTPTDVDFARLKPKTAFKVGDNWDPLKVERIYDTKATISGSMDADQKERLLNLAGGDKSKLYIARAPWVIDDAGKFVSVKNYQMFKLVFKMSVAGAGASLYVLNALHVDDYLAQFEGALENFERSGRTNLYWRGEMESAMSQAIDAVCVEDVSAAFIHRLFTDKFLDDLNRLPN